jgi:hypothetical protein
MIHNATFSLMAIFIVAIVELLGTKLARKQKLVISA